MWTSHGRFHYAIGHKYRNIHVCKTTVSTLTSLRQSTVSVCAAGSASTVKRILLLWNQSTSAKHLSLMDFTLTTPATCIMAIALNFSTSDLYLRLTKVDNKHVQIQTFVARAFKPSHSFLRRGFKV